MNKVKLVVRLLQNDETVGGYVGQLELPFVPCIGMKFEKGNSTMLWETTDNDELSPAVEEVVYHIDEEEIVCLFTIDKPLAASFWHKLKSEELGTKCAELNYFRFR